MASVLKVDKLDPQSGTALEIGTSGDTISVPSGATLDISASTLTPPATMPASSGVNLTALNATQLTSGKVPTAQLGTGTASSSTILYGDQTYKAEPSGGAAISGTPANNQFAIWTGATDIEGSSTNLIYDGTDVTVTSGSIKFATAGEGLNFSGNSRTATLDDYEEGSWTPDLNYAGDSTGVTMSQQNGSYTRIGNRVLFRGTCVCTAKGSGTGHARLSGLPFTAQNAGWDEHASTIYFDNTVDCWAMSTKVNTTHMALYHHVDDGTGYTPTYKAQFSDSVLFFVAGNYQTS